MYIICMLSIFSYYTFYFKSKSCILCNLQTVKQKQLTIRKTKTKLYQKAYHTYTDKQDNFDASEVFSTSWSNPKNLRI